MKTTLQHSCLLDSATDYVWLKGNLHTHSNRSDGSRPMQDVIDAYAALKYDFLAMTDHDIFADLREIDPRGMVLLIGNEVTAFGPHLLQIGGERRVEPFTDRQQVIDQVRQVGGWVVVNHPNWQENFDHCPYELMHKLTGYVGMEIFNGLCVDHNGSGYALDKWDRLLSAGRKIWGFANDDSHFPENDGQGWNMVAVPRNQINAAAIMNALRDGRFYPSTGVTIDAIEVDGAEVRLKAANAQAIEIYGEHGRRIARVEGSEIRIDTSRLQHTFIRAQLYGTAGRMAWTQPFWIQGGAAERRRAMEEKWSSPGNVLPKLQATRVEELPPLGSESTESRWATAAGSDEFLDADSADPAAVRTEVQALISRDQLALRVICHEPQMDQIRPRITQNGNSSIWAEESVELFLDPTGKRGNYYHLMINPLGAWHVSDRAGWHRTVRADARAWKKPDRWIVEIRFDLATLAPDLRVAPGATMALHVSRNRKVAKQRLVWCWTGSNNHRPERFGQLML